MGDAVFLNMFARRPDISASESRHVNDTEAKIKVSDARNRIPE